jgi:DNA invertase Pin-like site-specific DNA recombinase
VAWAGHAKGVRKISLYLPTVWPVGTVQSPRYVLLLLHQLFSSCPCTDHNDRSLYVHQRDTAVELIAYYRVSTSRQGESGLGIEAQRAKVQQLAADRRAEVVAEFVEVENGTKTDRPQLAAALAEARRRGAAVAVAKLDRIARDAEFVLRLSREAEANGMAGFLFCDLPDVDGTTAAGRMVLTVMASVAEFEARRIGERTREALAAAKARGVKLGGLRPGTITRNEVARAKALQGAENLRPILVALQGQGASLREMAQALAAAGTTTRTGKPLSASGVKNHLIRLDLAAG